MINSAPIQLEVSLASVLTDLLFQTGPVQVRIENLIFSRNIFIMQHVIIFFHFLVLLDCSGQNHNRVWINPGLVDVRDVASAIIPHEHTETKSAVFKF